jgi:hypothetical protein
MMLCCGRKDCSTLCVPYIAIELHRKKRAEYRKFRWLVFLRKRKSEDKQNITVTMEKEKRSRGENIIKV